MSNLPQEKNTTAKRQRVLLNNGQWYATWYKVLSDGTLVLDEQYHSTYKKGEWRYIWENETKSITYSEV